MRQSHQISWTAREAFAVAYCWAEFTNPHDRDETPEQYWLSISERARNECRAVANKRLLLAVARGQAVGVLPASGLREGELDALKAALGMKADHRVRKILDAIQMIFRRSANLTPACAASDADASATSMKGDHHDGR